MKRLLIALALFFIPAAASAQCNGVFPNNTVCGNITGANNTPRPTNPSAFLGAAGGTNGQIQYNNSGALGGFTAGQDATINTSTGAVNVTRLQNIPVTSTGASTNDVMYYNGTGWLHNAVTSVINAACLVSPSTCATLFGYANPAWWGAGTADDSTIMLTVMQYASGAAKPVLWNGNYNISSLVVTGLSGNLHIIGAGSAVGSATGSHSAVIEFKDVTGVVVEGNIAINCSGNAGYSAGVKVWSDGVSSGQFNSMGFSEIANCQLAYQFGDPTAPNVSISENYVTKGFFFNVAQGIKVIGSQALTTVSNFTNNVTPGSWGVTTINYWAVGGSINVIGGEAINAASTTGKIAQIDTLAATGNPYGIIHITGAEIEWGGALMNTSNPTALTSPLAGAFYISNSFGNCGNSTLDAIVTDSTFTGKISAEGNRFFATATRSNKNITLAQIGVTAFFDLQSFGTNFPQGYAGATGGIQYMSSKDVPPGVVYNATALAGPGDSIVSFACSSTCTYTMLAASNYPGRTLYMNNASGAAVNSASTNILTQSGTTTTVLLPGTLGKWVQLVSDQSAGNFWRIVANN